MHKTLRRCLTMEQNAVWMSSAWFCKKEMPINSLQPAHWYPPSRIGASCWFSLPLRSDVLTEGKWTITRHVAAHGSSLLSNETRKPCFISADTWRRLFFTYGVKHTVHTTPQQSLWIWNVIIPSYAQGYWMRKVKHLQNQIPLMRQFELCRERCEQSLWGAAQWLRLIDSPVWISNTWRESRWSHDALCHLKEETTM